MDGHILEHRFLYLLLSSVLMIPRAPRTHAKLEPRLTKSEVTYGQPGTGPRQRDTTASV